MSKGAELVKQQHFYCEAYHAEWKLNQLMCSKDKKFVTPPFCPLSNLDVKFCFEIWYLINSSDLRATVKIVLVKVSGSNLPTSLKLELEVTVHWNGKVMKGYYNLPTLTVEEMDNYLLDDKISFYLQYIARYDTYSYNGFFGNGLQPLILKCRMKFFDHLEKTPANCLTRPAFFSLKTSETSSYDLKCFKRSDEFSDILIRVRSKLFLAHKAVLSHHSPVFKQMIIDKADDETALIVDELCDDFDRFLDYLYSEHFECTSWPLLRDLYVLSAKYEVDALKQKCVAAILPLISVDKVSGILKVACDYEDSSLKEPALKFAVEHIRDVISSKEWKELIISHPLIGHEIIGAAFI